MGFSIWELLVVLIIVALLFGTKKIGSIGEDLGKAVKGFRNAIKDNDSNPDDTPPTGTVIENNSENTTEDKNKSS